MSFRFVGTDIENVWIVSPTSYYDRRGMFLELYKSSSFTEKGFNLQQINMSISRKNVIRGLHYQKEPSAQAKLVYVLKGAIKDVVVDLKTKKHIKVILTEDYHNGILIPHNMGHGFVALEEDTVVVYGCDNEYDSNLDSGIRYDSYGIEWNIENPIVSDKDLMLPFMQ